MCLWGGGRGSGGGVHVITTVCKWSPQPQLWILFKTSQISSAAHTSVERSVELRHPHTTCTRVSHLPTASITQFLSGWLEPRRPSPPTMRHHGDALQRLPEVEKATTVPPENAVTCVKAPIICHSCESINLKSTGSILKSAELLRPSDTNLLGWKSNRNKISWMQLYRHKRQCIKYIQYIQYI